MMRWVFIALLAANVAYLGFEFDTRLSSDGRESTGASPPREIPAGVERLVLVRELERPPDIVPSQQPLPDPEPTPPAEGADIDDTAAASAANASVADAAAPVEPELLGEPPAAGPLGRCFSVGPFKDDAASRQMVDWLRARNAAIAVRSGEVRERKRFWVYLEPLATTEEARATVQEMRDKGVQDLMLFSSGDLKNAISLGVFSTQEAVHRRLAELSDRGYQPVVVPQYRSNTAVWLDVESDASDIIAREDFPQLASGIETQSRPCDEIAKLGVAP